MALVLAGAAGAARAQEAAPVGVDAVRVEPLDQTQPVIGRFVARQAGEVAARTAGSITALPVQVGDRVKTGDVIAALDVERLTWQRDLAASTAREMEALLDSAESQLVKRRQELARLEGIRQSAAFNQARYEDAVQDLATGEAAVAAAGAVLARVRANLRIAEDDLRHGRVLAPYDGVISRRLTEVGAYVQVGDPVASMINEDDLEVEADVPYNRMAGMQPDTVVTIELADGSSHNAVVRAIGAEENPMTRTRQVRFTPAVEGARVKNAVGESVAVGLPLGAPREVVTVHKDAILKRQGMSLVYVVGEDDTAQVRPVELGEAVGPRFEVLGGVAAGEMVVVRGNERLRPGQAVAVTADEAASAEGASQ
ncbi:MAG TPA: efflux RND transporter periplasmic adaptor subunit [Alphaproteobacteria bacterium]